MISSLSSHGPLYSQLQSFGKSRGRLFMSYTRSALAQSHSPLTSFRGTIHSCALMLHLRYCFIRRYGVLNSHSWHSSTESVPRSSLSVSGGLWSFSVQRVSTLHRWPISNTNAVWEGWIISSVRTSELKLRLTCADTKLCS